MTMSGDPLEISPRRVGSPRLDPYQRLLARFYEQLFFLEALGQTRGSHTPEPPDHGIDQALRRSFLRKLCYICDFKTGGAACTALAIENLNTSYKFWIASNMEIDHIAKFCRLALRTLQDIAVSPDSAIPAKAKEEDFTQTCVEFATERVRMKKLCLRRNAKICITALMSDRENPRLALALWLKKMAEIEDHLPLCQHAYEVRQAPEMAMLRTLASEAERNLDPTSRRSPFILTRHYIGRLSDHIRAPKRLVRDSQTMSHLLETHVVGVVHPPSSVLPPRRDSQTNLRGILNRMIKPEDPEKCAIEEGFCYINHVDGLFDRFLRPYKYETLPIHSEIQILEHFYQKKLSFVGDDCFIACSKPACLCCLMYFKYHPARPVIPPSHLKVWAKWSPPSIEGFDNRSPESTQQRTILNKMVQEFREQASSQVLQRSKQERWHADSIAGITERTGIELLHPTAESSAVSNTENVSQDLQYISTSHSNMNPGSDIVDISDQEDGGVPITF